QLFDVAQLVINQPLPAGRRVGVVTNSDALGSLAADAAVSWGLEVTHGPVSVPAEARTEAFRDVVEQALADPAVDALIACFIPPVAQIDPEVVDAVEQAVDRSDKPCVATFLGMRGVGSTHRLPVYPTPEDGV